MRINRWLVIAVLLLGLFASYGTVHANEPVKLVFMGRDGPYEQAMQFAIDLYRQQKPNVEIEYVGLPWSGLRERIAIELVEGRGDFDIVVLDDPWTAEYLPTGFLTDLDALFAASGGAPNEDFIGPALNLGRWPYPDGTLYTLPIVGNVQMIAYHQGLFTKHGLQHPPETWADVLHAAEVIHSAEEDVFGVVFRGSRGNDLVATFLPILWAHGGYVVRDGKSGLLEPEFLRAVEVLLALKQFAPEDVDVYQADAVSRALLAGRAAMSIEVWPAWIPQLDDPAQSTVVGAYQIAPHPAADMASAPMLGIWLAGIPATSRNQQAAFEFLQFVTSHDVQKMQAAQTGNPPVLAGLYEDAQLIGQFRWYPAQLEALQSGVARPRIAEWSRVEDILGGFLHEALVGIRTPQDALQQAHVLIERALR